MTTNAAKFLHMSGGKALALAAHVDAAQPSADLLCRSGFAYPTATALAAMIKAGIACVEPLRQCGFSSDDAKTLSAAIVTRGAH